MSELYTVYGYDKDGSRKTTKIIAENHIQHVWNETTLQGVSVSGLGKIDGFKKEGLDLRIEIAGIEIKLLN